ncbi:MAG: hypothetical protein B0D92_03840 [Spirochaeta sp. LUC14_002_19_P3]|nr:MAG: hypothetical protein B0D92_03840 [Spirochaeta sp. LUC14_002_19_P3]
MVYLDWAATAPPDPEVMEVMAAAAKDFFGNPSALYPLGKKAKAVLEESRSRCAAVLKCCSNQLTFSSGGTESNAIALLSLLLSPTPGTAVFSGFEHPSVSGPLKVLESRGWKTISVQPDKDGIVRPEALLRLLERHPDTRFVSVMGVNNEIGSIQPLDMLAKAVRAFGNGRRIHFHADLVQAAGKMPLSLADLDVDTAAFSAHKFRGPRGMGLFYHHKPNFEALLRGSGQESGIRPGTENTAGAFAMALALEKYACPDPAVAENGAWLLREIRNIPEAKIIPQSRLPDSPLYVPGIIAAAFPPLPGEVLARVLAESGYAVSRGSACGKGKKSSIPAALNLPKETAAGMIRISYGADTSKNDLKGFIEALKSVIEGV